MSSEERNHLEGSGTDAAWPRGDGLDELLGLDPTPRLSEDAVRAIHARLAEEGDGALDALLGLDEVEVPTGLAGRVLARVDAEEAAARRRRRRLRLVPLAAAAAAAVALVVLVDRGGPATPSQGSSTVADGAADDAPDDEFLAALPALEDLDFLTEDLDPLEADALFLIDAEDALLLDLVEMGG